MNALTGFMRRLGRRDLGDPTKLEDLFLMVDDSGWRAARVMYSGSAEAVEVKEQSGAPRADANAATPIEAVFADVARNLGNPRGIGRIHILLDDPGGAYIDLLKENLASAGQQVMNAYCAELVGQPRVCWARARLAGDETRGREAQVLGAQGMVTLNSYLTRLEENVTKVSRLVPVLDMMRRHLVAGGETEPIAGLYVAERHSHLLMLHPGRGGVVSRRVPLGRGDLVDAIRDDMGVEANEAASMFYEHDLLSGVSPSDDSSDMTTSAVARAIGPKVRRFIAGLAETLDYFETQRALGRPSTLKILGSERRLLGLSELLGKALAMEAVDEEFDPFLAFRALALDDGMNLLSEMSADLQIGSVSYRMHHGSILSVGDIAREAKLREREPVSGNDIRGRKPRRRGGRRSRAIEIESSLFARFFSSGNGTSRAAGGGTGVDQAAQDRQVGLLAILVILAAGYFGYLEIEDRERRLRGDINTMGQTYRENVDLKKNRDEATRAITRGGEIDKVLWTEKFLSLAENMNESMWLTDVYLEVNNRTIGESEIEEKKLIIQGAVLPSTDGHILQIAEFVERLEEDKLGFMDDFREIVFDGAFLDRGESDAVVRFTIEARYDAKKRQAVASAKPSARGSTLGETTKKVEERNKAQEQAIGGGTQQ
ncbi:MAG: hypothetical protein ISP41_05885 [Alphaproteobacteria bacterium]|nr:hypothetical protein [Alphaproteobacteria bacterium]